VHIKKLFVCFYLFNRCAASGISGFMYQWQAE